jgi:hypothetical protein
MGSITLALKARVYDRFPFWVMTFVIFMLAHKVIV